MTGNEFFRNLHSFFAAATQEKFEALWGREIGEKLWMEWAGHRLYRFDLMSFLGNLDLPDLELLYSFLTKGQ